MPRVLPWKINLYPPFPAFDLKIKLDENMPCDEISSWGAGHDVDTVVDEDLVGRDDAAVWAACQEEGRFFITQDLDFSDIRKYLPGTHGGILLIRLADPSRSALNARLMDVVKLGELEFWVGYFIVATDAKIRIRRPTV